MARYYFHLRDGQDILIDPEGREIGDVSQIPALVLKEVRSMMSQDALEGHIRFNQSIDVLDMSGRVVYHLSFRDAVTVVE